jgi:hypothetical protein
MEAVSSFETFVNIPEDSRLYAYHHENLKSHVSLESFSKVVAYIGQILLPQWCSDF